MSPSEEKRMFDTGFHEAITSLRENTGKIAEALVSIKNVAGTVKDMQTSCIHLGNVISLVDKNQALLALKLDMHVDDKRAHRGDDEPPCKPLKTHIGSHKKYSFLMITTLVGVLVTIILGAGVLLIQLGSKAGLWGTSTTVVDKDKNKQP